MGKSFALVVGLLLVSTVVHCSDDGLQVKPNAISGSDPKSSLNLNDTNNSNGKNSVLNPNEVERVKTDKDQVGGSKEVANGTDKSGSSRQTVSKEAQHLQLVKGGSGKELKTKEAYDKKENQGDKKENQGDNFGTKEEPNEPGNKGKVVTSDPVREEGSRANQEECDLSNQCTADDRKLVACLRVPGNDSPVLSLLIQNKGKNPLTISISAPKSVQLGTTEVQLQENRNTEVKVTIQDEGTDSMIVLTAGNGNCSLDFKDLILHSTREEGDSSVKYASTYKNLMSRRYAIAFLSFSAVLIIASLWICISFRGRKLLSSDGFKYQKLDADIELPVSSRGKPDADINDEWDNSWGDNWDDEEAPHTPSMPITPSLSAKGLASRRLTKDAWKD
ncbi:hypothetical protein FNV43_RR09408 [Rhamnella rubrinervis]|uniref:DUF7356 domain-containing protein n=1 Tax=Rhamnella rubrinervis TaxID=2594499 RepID=A0A8K0HB63_9ROSA|nr:hypothetical protein FNV43_RR09408 [Rhamnella rubrinervis]